MEDVVVNVDRQFLLTPDRDRGKVRASDDGLPVLNFDREVANADLLAAIAEERANR